MIFPHWNPRRRLKRVLDLNHRKRGVPFKKEKKKLEKLAIVGRKKGYRDGRVPKQKKKGADPAPPVCWSQQEQGDGHKYKTE